MKQFRLLLMALAGILVFASCSKDEEEEQLPGGVSKYEYLDATSYTKWVYFSFKTGDTVTVSDPTNDLSWDIAFHRGDIRLNGGESGKGSGAAFNTELTDWDAVTEAPTSGYISDKTGTIITAFTGQGVEEAQQSFSQTLGTWLTIDTSNPPPKYTYHNYIYVVKSADGKYVKLQVYDYKNEKNAGAYISFKYQYNESGSSQF